MFKSYRLPIGVLVAQLAGLSPALSQDRTRWVDPPTVIEQPSKPTVPDRPVENAAPKPQALPAAPAAKEPPAVRSASAPEVQPRPPARQARKASAGGKVRFARRGGRGDGHLLARIFGPGRRGPYIIPTSDPMSVN